MGDRLRAVTKPTRSTQLCIPLGSLNREPALIGWGKGGNVTSAGWQVTLCDPIWHVSSRSGEALWRTAISGYFTLLYFKTWCKYQCCLAALQGDYTRGTDRWCSQVLPAPEADELTDSRRCPVHSISSADLSPVHHSSTNWAVYLPLIDVRSLETAHQKSLRLILGIHWYNCITNKEFLQHTSQDFLSHYPSSWRTALFRYDALLGKFTPAHMAPQYG